MCEVSDEEFMVSNLLHATNASLFWFYKLFVTCWQMWIQLTHMSDRHWRSTELPKNLRPLFTGSSQVKKLVCIISETISKWLIYNLHIPSIFSPSLFAVNHHCCCCRVIVIVVLEEA
jgi:hypothetical protein